MRISKEKQLEGKLNEQGRCRKVDLYRLMEILLAEEFGHWSPRPGLQSCCGL